VATVTSEAAPPHTTAMGAAAVAAMKVAVNVGQASASAEVVSESASAGSGAAAAATSVPAAVMSSVGSTQVGCSLMAAMHSDGNCICDYGGDESFVCIPAGRPAAFLFGVRLLADREREAGQDQLCATQDGLLRCLPPQPGRRTACDTAEGLIPASRDILRAV